jgi:hypothetical protein
LFAEIGILPFLKSMNRQNNESSHFITDNGGSQRIKRKLIDGDGRQNML